jgi:hypothetical protein
MWHQVCRTIAQKDEAERYAIPSAKIVSRLLQLLHSPMLCTKLQWMTGKLWVACERSTI